jgi:hypothetical protein
MGVDPPEEPPEGVSVAEEPDVMVLHEVIKRDSDRIIIKLVTDRFRLLMA